MSNADENLIQSITEDGIAAVHPRVAPLPMFVAPTTADQYNTLRLRLAPIACWSVGDARFEFGSSFIRPEVADDVRSLATLIDSLKNKLGGRPLASIFGHADPVGQQTFNKSLSGRRAAAVYALLTRRDDIWEDIFSNTGKFTSPLEDDQWGSSVIEIILVDLGYTNATQQTEEAVEKFQGEHGLVVDGDAGPLTREKLFRAYMEKHCRTKDGSVFQLNANDFLARGEDPSGKGDYQGCSEFNPLVIFSQKDASIFSRAEMKGERDAANQPNRRVLVYLFHPTAYSPPALWPCPRAKEDITGCQKRLWSDADQRLANACEQREYQDSNDTFACRFYHRLAERSPCEQNSIKGFAVYLLDPRRERLPGAEWRVSSGKHVLAEGTASEEALAIVSLVEVPEIVKLEWRGAGHPEAAPFPYSRELFPLAGAAQTADNLRLMLTNVGYDQYGEESKNVEKFQADFGLERTGEIDDIKNILKKWHETGEAPRAREAGKLGESGEGIMAGDGGWFESETEEE